MTRFSVPDMSCGHCRAAVVAALGAVPEAGEIRVDLDTRTVEVTGPAPTSALLEALKAAGYPAQPV